MHRHRDIASERTRHPLCPYCRYDLVASVDPVAPRFVRCPECGEEIEPDELQWQRRRGDWTLAQGLRSAFVSAATRTILVAVLWAGMLIGMDALLDAILGSGVLFFRVMFIPLALSGIIVAWIMHHRLGDHAGFESWLLTWLAILGAWAGLHVGHALADAMYTLSLLAHGGWSVVTGVMATMVILFLALREQM